MGLASKPLLSTLLCRYKRERTTKAADINWIYRTKQHSYREVIYCIPDDAANPGLEKNV